MMDSHSPKTASSTIAPTSAPDRKARLFIVSAPSGAGKTTLCHEILKNFPDIRYSISHTTRQPRKNETHGVDYFFITPEEFTTKIKEHHWAEWAEVYGNYYGTSARFIDQCMALGQDVLLDIDVNGTRQILHRYPDSVTIFILPPSLEVLKQRLIRRGTDSEATVARRLENAVSEMACQDLYQHVVVNDALPDAVRTLCAIIARHRAGSTLPSNPP